jgi:hypothetical protein
MTVMELKDAYASLAREDQVLLASLILAEQLSAGPDFKAILGRRHQTMDEGRKWQQDEVLRLHEELDKQGL